MAHACRSLGLRRQGHGAHRRQHHPGRAGGVVGRHGVVDDGGFQGVGQRDAAAGPGRHVVVDHVVGDRHREPFGRCRRVCCDVRTVDLLQPDAAALPAFGEVAANHVGVDGQAAGAQRQGPGHRRLAADVDAAAVGRGGLLEALVEQHRVIYNLAALAEADVADAAAVRRAVVAADPVVVDAVAVGAGADRHTAARTAVAGRAFDGAVPGDRVVVNLDILVVAERRHIALGVGRQAFQLQIRNADPHATVEGAGVAVDAVIGDLQVVRPAVDVDAAAGVAAGHADAVDARGGAQEVAVGDRSTIGADSPACALTCRQVLGQHRDAGAFFGAQHAGLEQHHAAGDLLRRQRVDLRRAGRVAGDHVDREQRIDAVAPALHFVVRILGRVDDHRGRTHALQAHRLPHDHEFVVGAGVDQDQVARGGSVDRGLDGLARRGLNTRGRAASHRDGNGIHR